MGEPHLHPTPAGKAVVRIPLFLVAALCIAACSSSPKPAATGSRPASAPRNRAVRETVEVRDPELERRIARLELRVMEKETQVEELQTRLDDARDEVVRTMEKLRTIASRAEAASAMAEADVAMQGLRSNDRARQLPEFAQANRLMNQSTAEFNKENYGGALYLANQAKSAAAAGRSRLDIGARGTTRPGEVLFALPIRLKVVSRGNVREGPGTNFPVVFEATTGVALSGFAYTDEWVRVADEAGRSGWIFRNLVGRP
jgi:uncharacterized coiled-coil protein SlyX